MVAFVQYRARHASHHPGMSETRTYEGSCHCGAVRFEIDMAPPEKAFTCNCSICNRAGWLLGFGPESAFRLVAGEGELSDYQFGRKHIHHVFCRTCGIRGFSRGTDAKGNKTIAVNLRCLAGVDATALPVESFDGASL
jgi:hypothetical protein